jgi:hypothetical protein
LSKNENVNDSKFFRFSNFKKLSRNRINQDAQILDQFKSEHLKGSTFLSSLNGSLTKKENVNLFNELNKTENIPISKFQSKSLFFQNLNIFLMKLFLNKELTENDLGLNTYEIQIIKEILIKKKYPIDEGNLLDLKILNNFKNCTLIKKNEDMLKFVIKKCIRTMQTEFINHIKSSFVKGELIFKNVSITEIKKNKDKFFYLYYFDKISKEDNIPIEQFYHFRSWKNRNLKDIPKSVTKQSLKLWKKNPVFIKKMISYIQFSLKDSFIEFNKTKINKMIEKWEKIIETHGKEEGIEKILSKFKLKGNKLPWTISEVENAINYTLQNLL